ncbi:MAG: hypothetical protein ACRDDY_03610 [Clostridium sp.]|uniref:hypothetical protein n=1 Tax=Clostridium sp. TaxID=1506 RepID=UPI003EE484A3
MIKKPKITKEQKELDNKFKELNGNIVYQILVSDKGFDKSSSELEEVVKESRGNGFLYKTKDEEVFMYVEGRLDELDKNKVYFYTENDILVITSMSEENLMKKVKSIHNFFGELIQEKVEVDEKSEEEINEQNDKRN